MHALRNIHAALVPGGITVDTQPVSPRPALTASGVELGTGDLREWAATVDRIDRQAAKMVTNGRFRLSLEERFTVTDAFSSGPECLDIMRGWSGTRIPRSLARRLATVEGEVQLHQEVRLRLLVARRAEGTAKEAQ